MNKMNLYARKLLLLVALTFVPFAAIAQSPGSPAPNPAAQQILKADELDALVAPIALYPDPLLAEVLMASAYPLEVVRAERWLQANKNLKGDKLEAAVGKQPWDESIKSLVATPSVLEMMSNKLDWTQKLGDAVVAQQSDVMDAIQRLRAKAQANNKLTSTKQQAVTVSQVQGKQLIAIEPTDPETVYVPYYDPAVVYGSWPYPNYPPYYWPPPPYLGAGVLAAGIAFGAGYALGAWSGGYWNGNVNWSGGGNNITVNPPGNRPGNRPSHPIGGGGNKWQPRVEHRQGVGNRGGQREFRGSRGQQVLKPGTTKPGGGRANLGEHHRPSQGARVSHRAQTKRPTSRPSHRAGVQHRARVAAPHARGGRGSLGGHGGLHRGGGGGMRAHGGGGRGGGGRGGGRRSDIRVKHDITLLGRLDNGLGFYRFSYNGSSKAYVGVIAQEVEQVMPQAVVRGQDGYLRVYYRKLGLDFESYDRWIRSGAQVPHPLANIAAPR